ncbi:hypothetical protein BURK2_02321 [Burkholderiales bacterium]|nr:MAG: Uma2 family endonuclease [Burkholderiales bacterium]CAG0989867.1 hypothetical protein BURK2_02321 [Burkholderiales bacterium]
MGHAKRDTLLHTYADYLGWPEEIRYELIDGVAFHLGPAPTRRHQDVVGEVYFQTRTALEGKPCRAYVSPFDVRLPKGNEADAFVDTVVQPDVLVVCDPRKLDARGMRGAPDWVVEVLSPASSGYDQTLKLAAYERAGVPEVWLVHPIDRIVTVYLLHEGRYGRPRIHELLGELAVGVLPDIVIDWSRLPPEEEPATGDS